MGTHEMYVDRDMSKPALKMLAESLIVVKQIEKPAKIRVSTPSKTFNLAFKN